MLACDCALKIHVTHYHLFCAIDAGTLLPAPPKQHCDLQVPYELVTVDFKSQEHKSPAFKKMQPFGKVCH